MTAIAVALVLSGCGNEDEPESASCAPVPSADPSLDQWTTTDGCALAPEVIHSHPGPAECGWELVDYIVIGPDTYHWDPVNFLSYVDGFPRNRTLPSDDLPDAVVDTGLRRGDETLWHHPDDPQYVYLVDGKFADRYLLDVDGRIVCES